MSKNQKVAFWSVFVGFCLVGTSSIYAQGALESINTMGASVILVFAYLLVGFVIYLFIKKNPERVDKWFKE